jgi:hypothetical protein
LPSALANREKLFVQSLLAHPPPVWNGVDTKRFHLFDFVLRP